MANVNLVWLNARSGEYDAFDVTNPNHTSGLDHAYYEVDFQDQIGTKVYVSYLLGSEDGVTGNKTVTDAEIASVMSRYNSRQAALAQMVQDLKTN